MVGGGIEKAVFRHYGTVRIFLGLVGLDRARSSRAAVAVTFWFEKRQRATGNSLHGGRFRSARCDPIVIAWLSTFFVEPGRPSSGRGLSDPCAIVRWMASPPTRPRDTRRHAQRKRADTGTTGKRFTWGGLWKTATSSGRAALPFRQDRLVLLVLLALPVTCRRGFGGSELIWWVGGSVDPVLFGRVGGVY